MPRIRRRQNAFIDRLAVFGIGLTFSALSTIGVSFLTIDRAKSHKVLSGRDVLSASLSSHPVGRTSFLARVFLDQETQLRGEMSFLAKIIEKRLKNHHNPHELALQIVTESFLANYDPIFVAAVINAESTFKHRAVSERGASGLMQLMPDTAKYVSQMQNVAWRGSKELYEPTYNLRLGIAYLKYLEKKFRGNREKVLIAYNWGPGNLELALKNQGYIPSEPIKYAKGIISTHSKWKQRYSTMSLSKNETDSTIG